jgi:hypothetical protein
MGVVLVLMLKHHYYQRDISVFQRFSFNIVVQMRCNSSILFTTVALVLLLFLVQACKSDCGEQTIEKKGYTTNYQKLFPQRGTEVLYFRKNQTDTLAFVGIGKKDTFVDMFRPEGDCIVRYRCYGTKTLYRDTVSGKNLEIRYFINSETNEFEEYFQLFYNQKPLSAQVRAYNEGRVENTVPIQSGGVNFPYTMRYANEESKDSVYVTFDSNVLLYRRKIVRFRYGNDVYEVVP